MSDSSGGVLNRDGIDIPAPADHKKLTASVKNSGPGEDISRSGLLGLDLD